MNKQQLKPIASYIVIVSSIFLVVIFSMALMALLTVLSFIIIQKLNINETDLYFLIFGLFWFSVLLGFTIKIIGFELKNLKEMKQE